MKPQNAVLNPADALIDVEEIVRDTLTDVTPRGAALALMRFPDYVDLIAKAGVEPTEELCAALFAELKGICARDRHAL